MGVASDRPTVSASTVRNRRRRERLARQGIAPTYYELPTVLVEALEKLAAQQKMSAAEYLTGMLAVELVRKKALIGAPEFSNGPPIQPKR